MLELDSTYPDQEDITIEFNRLVSSIRDNLTDLEILFKKIFEGKTFIDEDEVAKILRCKVEELPQKLPKYRPSRNTYLYKVSELFEFIEERKLGGK